MFLEIRGYFEISVSEISRLERLQINMVCVPQYLLWLCHHLSPTLLALTKNLRNSLSH